MNEPIPAYVPKLTPSIRPRDDGTFGLTYSEPNGTLRKMVLTGEQLASLGCDIDRIRLVRGAEWTARVLAEKAAASSG